MDGRRSNDALVAGSGFNSPTIEDGPGMPAMAPAFLGGGPKQGYALVSEQAASPSAERLSFESHNSQRDFSSKATEPAFTSSRQTHLDDGDRWSKGKQPMAPASPSTNRHAPTASTSSTVREPILQTAIPSSSRPRANSHHKSQGGDWQNESRNATPKAARFAAQEESLFGETSPIGPPSRAVRPSDYSQQRTDTGTPKKMTKAQF